MTSQVNQQLVLEIPVEGAPAPETVWLKDDAELKSDDVVRVSHAANCAKLMFIPARRLKDHYFIYRYIIFCYITCFCFN
jgi:hypothetical protein